MWALLIKEIDGVPTIVKGGRNVIVDDNYDGTIITDEQYARQIDKLELLEDGRSFKVKEGYILQTLEQINNIEQIMEPSSQNINLKLAEEV